MAEANKEDTRSYVVARRDFDLHAIILNIGGVKGFEAVIAVDKFGEIVHQVNKAGIDVEALRDSILDVAKEVSINTQELGIGRFHTGEIDGPWGHIYITVLGQTTLISQFDTSAHGEDVLARIERIAESCSKES